VGGQLSQELSRLFWVYYLAVFMLHQLSNGGNSTTKQTKCIAMAAEQRFTGAVLFQRTILTFQMSSKTDQLGIG
jgi:hypothetical protein